MWNKLRVIFLTGMIMLASVALALAQDNPNCDGDDDPDLTCPVDSWVWVLVALTLGFTLIYWYRQKSGQQSLKSFNTM